MGEQQASQVGGPERPAEVARVREVAAERRVREDGQEKRCSDRAQLAPQRTDHGIDAAVLRAGEHQGASGVADQGHHRGVTGREREVDARKPKPEHPEGDAALVAAGKQCDPEPSGE